MSTYPKISRGDMAADVLQRDFTQIHNRLFRDPALSFKAKGIFGLVSTHRDGFGVTPKWIAQASTDGVSAVKAGLQELEECGYLTRSQERKPDGTLGAMTYAITDMPRSQPVDENRPPALTCDDPMEHGDCEDGAATQTRRSEPRMDFPPAVDPPAVDRTPKKTSDQKTQSLQQEPAAPSARSATDAGGNTSGSRDRGTGGAAASGKTRNRLSKAQYAAISAVRDLLPDDLNKALPAKTPTNVGAAILEALAAGSPFERTPAQLVEFRVMPRWRRYWVDKFYAGELGSIVGPFLAMLKQQTCGDLSCEEKVNINTGWPCRICEGRRAGTPPERDDTPAHPAAPDTPTAALPTPRSPTLAERPKCPGCERPLTDTMQPELCRDCREGASV